MRSLIPGRSRCRFPVDFLYPWLAKNFDTYKLNREASSSPRAKSFQLKKDPRTIGSTTAFPFVRVLCLSAVKATFSWSTAALIDSVDNLDVSTDLDFNNLPDLEIMLCCHHMLACSRTKVLLPGTTIRLRGITLAEAEYCWFYKPLEHFVQLVEYDSSLVKIVGIDVSISTTPIPIILIQSMLHQQRKQIRLQTFKKLSLTEICCTISRHIKLPIGVYKLTTKNVIELPPESLENIMDIRRLRAPQVRVSIVHSFNELLSTQGTGATPFESKVEGSIKHTSGLNDLHQNYSNRMIIGEQDSYHIEVLRKLDEASQ
ncbi:hypothetical protein Cgig2_017966 [Carnegiea gigantea]|uniref:Uncharacterized protein n=1 Tax=Carnegiea gigantea TaxID=171969 RepID=A0A9Q1QDU0_9CARY|nr:hypothetical protein Cgig2_017966 [Carnegiea gigantea]